VPSLQQMLKILSPIRPQQVRMTSELPGLAAMLRGGQQSVGQLLRQLQGKPGVQQGALTQMFGHVDPAARLKPQELADQARSPRLFAQRGMTGRSHSEDALQEAADDLVWGHQFQGRRMKVFTDELRTMADQGVIDKDDAYQLIGQYMVSPSVFESDVIDLIDRKGVGVQELIFEGGLMDEAYTSAAQELPNAVGKSMQPAYDQYQRQPGLDTAANAKSNYFETVLRGTPSRAFDRNDLKVTDNSGGYHFTNPSQLGYVRGSVTPDGGVYAEELQSDPLEVRPNLPALEGIYGKLGRMLVDRSAEAEALSVSFPDANRIASVRNQKQLPFFKSVYDRDLAKQLYEPLAKRGVPLRQENGWTTMDLPEGILNAIKNEGLLNHKKRGGSVP
jgi:hypothetical protein